MERIGATLRALRRHQKLTLRDVEKRSEKYAGHTGNKAFRISASWLNRLEREDHDMTASTAIVLAHIYGIVPELLICSASRADSATPQQTSLLCARQESLSGFYRWGIIGWRDQTLAPLVMAGSMVKIDTRMRVIGPSKRWASEFQRPIYFLRCRRDYFCGWCECDSGGSSVTLIPHPLSASLRQTWTDRDLIEVIGRVVAVTLFYE